MARDGTQSALPGAVHGSSETSAVAISPVLEWSNRLLNLANVIGAAVVSWGVVYIAIRNQAWVAGLLIMLGFSLSLTISLPLMVVAGSTILYQYDAVGLWLPMSSCIVAALSVAIPDSQTVWQPTYLRTEAPAVLRAAAATMMPAGHLSERSQPPMPALDWVGSGRALEPHEHQPSSDTAGTLAVSEPIAKHTKSATAPHP